MVQWVRAFASVGSPEPISGKENLPRNWPTCPPPPPPPISTFLEYICQNISNISVNSIQQNLELCLLVVVVVCFFAFKQKRVLTAVLKNDCSSKTVGFQIKKERGILFGSGKKHPFPSPTSAGSFHSYYKNIVKRFTSHTDANRPQINPRQVPSHCCCLNGENVI